MFSLIGHDALLHTLTLTPEDYMHGQIIGFMSRPSPGRYQKFVFGDIFMENFFTVFDEENVCVSTVFY